MPNNWTDVRTHSKYRKWCTFPSPQSCEANKYVNVVINFGDQRNKPLTVGEQKQALMIFVKYSTKASIPGTASLEAKPLVK